MYRERDIDMYFDVCERPQVIGTEALHVDDREVRFPAHSLGLPKTLRLSQSLSRTLRLSRTLSDSLGDSLTLSETL